MNMDQSAALQLQRIRERMQEMKILHNAIGSGATRSQEDEAYESEDDIPVPPIDLDYPIGISDKKPEMEKLDPSLVGMSVGYKSLYSGKEDRRGRFQWQDTIPEDVGKPAENSETQKWALIVRYVKVSLFV